MEGENGEGERIKVKKIRRKMGRKWGIIKLGKWIRKEKCKKVDR